MNRSLVPSFLPIFILAYLLLPYIAVARPMSVYPIPRQNSPSSTSAPGFGSNTASTTWTYNYWWPYPPPGAAVTIPAATGFAPPTASIDHITLVLPISASVSQVNSQDQASMSPRPLSNSTSPTTTTASSITSFAATSSSSTSPLPLTGNQGSDMGHSGSLPHKFNILYLVPFFAIAGVVLLAGIIWLTHGCCTRRPKYRPPPRASRSSDKNLVRIQTGTSRGYGNDKEALNVGLRPGTNDATFKAFRYEDLAADPDQQYSLDDAVWDVADRDSPPSCQHTREYGFQCDCRQSLIESEQFQYHWPRTQLQDIPDEEEYLNGAGPSGTLSPSTDVRSEADLLSQSGAESENELQHKMKGGNLGGKGGDGTIGRQEKLLEIVQKQRQKRRRVLRRGVTNKTKKSRALTKSMKSTKTAFTDLSVYSQDSDVGEALEQGDSEGFHMLVESPPPTMEGHIKPLRVGTRGKARVVETDGDLTGERWMDKVAEVFGSSLSRLSSGGKEEDTYTALPDDLETGRNRERNEKSSPRRRQLKHLHRTSRALQTYESSHRRRDTIDSIADMTEDDIEQQRRRLQHHRASIASLPAGMIYSPPILGVNVFGEEKTPDVPDSTASISMSLREKRLPRPPG